MSRVTEMFSKASVGRKVIKTLVRSELVLIRTQVRSKLVSMGRATEMFSKAAVR